MNDITPYLEALNNLHDSHPLASFQVRGMADCSKAVACFLLARERLERACVGPLEEACRALLAEFRGVAASGPHQDSDVDSGAGQTLLELMQCLASESAGLAGRSGPRIDDLRRQAAALAGRVNGELYRRFRDAFEGRIQSESDAVAEECDWSTQIDSISAILRSGDRPYTDATVRSVSPLSGGYSKITLQLEAECGEGAVERLVARLDGQQLISQSSVRDEFKLLKVLYEAGVSVPRPVAVGDLGSDGKALMIVEAMPGKVVGDSFTSQFRSQDLCQDMGKVLAEIHGVPQLRLASVPSYRGDSLQNLAEELKGLRAEWTGYGAAHPLMEYAFWWLEENLSLGVSEEGLVHGDFGLHNLLVEGERVTAVLDWEFARKGFPVEDLALVKILAESVWSWDCFLGSYIHHGGIRPKDDVLRYHFIFQMARIVVKLESTRAIFIRSMTRNIFAAAPHIYYEPFLFDKIEKTFIEAGIL